MLMHKKTVLIVGGIGLVVCGLLAGRYALTHRVGRGAISDTHANIPSDFAYTDEGEIPETLLVRSDYQNIQQVGGMFSDKFYCKNLQKDARIVTYWKQAGNGMLGGWSYRFAAVCGSEYVIVYGADYLGEAIYGPFFLK